MPEVGLKRQGASSNLLAGAAGGAAGGGDQLGGNQLGDPLAAAPAPAGGAARAPAPAVAPAPAPVVAPRAITFQEAYSNHFDSLLAFAKSEFSPENLEFLRLVDAGADSKWIYNRFCKPDARQLVNLPATMSDKIQAFGKKNQFDRISWGEARNEIFNLTARDTFVRWRASPAGQAATGGGGGGKPT